MKNKIINIKLVLILVSCFLSFFTNAQQLEIFIDEALTKNQKFKSLSYNTKELLKK